MTEKWSSVLSHLLVAVVSLVGLSAFLYPLVLPMQPATSPETARSNDALLVFAMLTMICLAIVLAEMQTDHGSTKQVALLGVLTAINAVLRLVETSTGIFNIGGMSPMFFLIILVGYVYGARLGFLLGAMSLFVSAVITGGMGPWLPYQMFGAGWVGMTASLLPKPAQDSDSDVAPRWEVWSLAAFGVISGLAFGALMNLYFWPYLSGVEVPAGGGSVIQRYVAFYAATSLWWDVGRAVGNAALIILLGRPTLKILHRFRNRFTYELLPQPMVTTPSNSSH